MQFYTNQSYKLSQAKKMPLYTFKVPVTEKLSFLVISFDT